MDKTSNATAAAYADLACRYSNLFQYNPAAAAAAAACAAAAYGMLNNQSHNNQTTTSINSTEQSQKELTKLNNGSTSSSVNSISSPTNSLTSSLSQSSTVSNNKFNNVVINQKIEEEEQPEKLEQLDSSNKEDLKQKVNSFEDDEQELDDQDDVFSDLNSTMSHTDRDDFNLDEANNIDLIVNNTEPMSKKQKLNHSRSSSTSSIISRQSSLVSPASSIMSNNSSYLLNVTRADDEANKLYSKKSLDKIQHNLELDAEKAIVTCFDKNQVKTEPDDSVQQSTQTTNSNQNGSISIGSILNSLTKNTTTSDDFKITKSDLDQFKFQLITSVNQAINKAFETFYEIKIKTNRTINTQQSSTNATPAIINSQQKSSSFNMSKLLETTTKPNKQAQDLSQKRKLNDNNQSNKHSAANLLLTTSKHSAFNSPNKQNQAPLNAAAMSHFYSAAMSHLQQNNKSTFSNAPNGLLNSTSLNPLLSSGLAPPPPPPPMPSQQPTQHNNNQFLLSLAAHQNNGQQQQQQHSAYLNNLANRLFTPYLMDNHKSYQPPAPQQVFNHHHHHHQMQQQPRHITPSGKRRRTKVTDTRLSPRNPAAAAALAAANQISRSLLYQSSSFLNKKQQLKEDVDQENDCDSDTDEMTSSNRQQNEDNESLSNGCTNNDTSYVSSHHHQLATMPNGCYSSSFQHDDNIEMMNSINGNNGSMSSSSSSTNEYYNGYQTSTLSSLHLRKAKLMFFFTRYPSSTILRNYFPDVKFNKANTAQLVKWFSNFREFFYIQMEKHARQHLAEGVQHAEDLHVDIDSEIFRALNSHYNRNNQLEIPTSFCYVIEQTLREFFRAIQENKDLDPSWKKAIYKVIARMDDSLPDFFKSIKWMETLETSIGGSVTGLGGIV